MQAPGLLPGLRRNPATDAGQVFQHDRAPGRRGLYNALPLYLIFLVPLRYAPKMMPPPPVKRGNRPARPGRRAHLTALLRYPRLRPCISPICPVWWVRAGSTK